MSIPGPEFGVSILSNVVSNVLCVGMSLLAVFGVYYLRRRRQLRRFFGITERRGSTVQIRLSNMYVKPGGSLSLLSIGDGYVGPALAAAEYRHAIDVVAAIQSPRSAATAYALVEQFGVKAVDRPVRCSISLSPYYVRTPEAPQPVDLDDDNDPTVSEIRRTLTAHECFVFVGSPVYNALTFYVLANCGEQTKVRFVESAAEPGHACSAVEILGYHHNGESRVFPRTTEVVDGTATYEEYFVLQKITNWGGLPVTIFLCAGTSGAATAAAEMKLARWRSLLGEFGYGPFCMVYAVRTPYRDIPHATDSERPLWTVMRVWPPER